MQPSSFSRSTRDRHGRRPRFAPFFPGTPAWKTRRERFDALVATLVADLTQRWPAVASLEFATEDVPPSDPAVWEDHSLVVGRIFPADRRRGLRDRIVLYRLPLMLRVPSQELYAATRRVLIDRIAQVLIIPPDEIDEALRS